jgi:hypothetical protein
VFIVLFCLKHGLKAFKNRGLMDALDNNLRQLTGVGPGLHKSAIVDIMSTAMVAYVWTYIVSLVSKQKFKTGPGDDIFKNFKIKYKKVKQNTWFLGEDAIFQYQNINVFNEFKLAKRSGNIPREYYNDDDDEDDPIEIIV